MLHFCHITGPHFKFISSEKKKGMEKFIYHHSTTKWIWNIFWKKLNHLENLKKWTIYLLNLKQNQRGKALRLWISIGNIKRIAIPLKDCSSVFVFHFLLCFPLNLNRAVYFHVFFKTILLIFYFLSSSMRYFINLIKELKNYIRRKWFLTQIQL